MTATLDPDLGFDDAEDYPTPIGAPTMVAPGVPRLTGYVPYAPRPKQRAFLCLRSKEAFYGGAAGSGKSDAFLMGALQFVDVPGYSALMLRKTFPDLNLPGALMHRSHLWLDDTDAKWSGSEHAWYFPGGGQLTFGYCENDASVQRYRSAEFQAIFVDESTQWSEYAYRFLFTRLRRPEQSGMAAPDGLTLNRVPLRMRAGSNPGDIGHAWNKRRFIDPETRRPHVVFIPARLEDMAGIVDVEGYTRMLRETDPVNWRRMRYGDWEIREQGQIFDITKVEMVDVPFTGPDHKYRRVRYWDLASTEATAANTDPDWTVGVRLALEKETGLFRIEHVERFRGEPHVVEARMRACAEMDGRRVSVRVEQEPGSSGKLYVDHLRRRVLRGFNMDGDRVTGPKGQRIVMVQPLVEHGDLSMTLGPWTQPVVDQMDAYPHVDHDDILDALAGAHATLTGKRGRILV